MGLPLHVPGGLLKCSPRPGHPFPRVLHLQPQPGETTPALQQAVYSPSMKCSLCVLLTQQQMKPTFLWVVTRWEEGILRHQSPSPAQGHLCSRPGSNMKPLRLGGPMGSPQIYSKSAPHLLTQMAGSFYDIISRRPHKPFSLRLVGVGGTR